MSTPPVLRVGDPMSHGGACITGSPIWNDPSNAIVRVGDTYECPLHGKNPMISGSSNWVDCGAKVCRITDFAQCGGTGVSGSPELASS